MQAMQFENQHPERDSCVNSTTRFNQRVREFCPKSHRLDRYLPHPERDRRETETFPNLGRVSQTARNIGENEKTP